MSVSVASEPAPEIRFPKPIAEAVALLDAHPGSAWILAGGTWRMRAPLRGERLPAMLVSLEKTDKVGAIQRRGGG